MLTNRGPVGRACGRLAEARSSGFRTSSSSSSARSRNARRPKPRVASVVLGAVRFLRAVLIAAGGGPHVREGSVGLVAAVVAAGGAMLLLRQLRASAPT